jgi:hypothetical protein
MHKHTTAANRCSHKRIGKIVCFERIVREGAARAEGIVIALIRKMATKSG